jgi:hypothetical protein
MSLETTKTDTHLANIYGADLLKTIHKIMIEIDSACNSAYYSNGDLSSNHNISKALMRIKGLAASTKIFMENISNE